MRKSAQGYNWMDNIFDEDPWVVCCCKDGTISLRQRGHPPFNGVALPVLSVHSKEEGVALQVLTCRLMQTRDPLLPDGWYKLGSGPFSMGFDGNVDTLPAVSRYLAEKLAMMRLRTATAARL